MQHPGCCWEKTHLNDLEKRSAQSWTTSPPCSSQSRIPQRLRTHLPPLTLFVYMFLPLTLQSPAGFSADSLTVMLSDPHGAARWGCAPFLRLGWLWVKDRKEEKEEERRRRTVRHLSGVCNPPAPPGAAESAPCPGTSHLRARCISAIWRALQQTCNTFQIDFLGLSFDWSRCAWPVL